MNVTIPLKTVSVLNTREHWRARAARSKLHRTSAWAEMKAADRFPRQLGYVVVTLTRIAPRELDGDNLQGALKAVRDGVADWLGVDDRDGRIEWLYGQEKGRPKTYAVRIEVAERAIAASSDNPVAEGVGQ